MRVVRLAVVLLLGLTSCGGDTQPIDETQPVETPRDAEPMPEASTPIVPVMDAGMEAAPVTPEPPLSPCLSIEENAARSCTEICAGEGKTCQAECYAEQVLPAEVAYYLDAASCEQDDVYALGNVNTCDETLGSSLLVGIVTYARCCCR